VGDAMLDRYLFGDVERISPEAPVPVVRVTRDEHRLGGAANVALNVKTLGPRVTLITVVGDDEPARKLEGLLKAQAVEVILGRDPKLFTCVKLRVIGRAQQLVRVDFENQPDHEVLGDMLSDFARVLPTYDAVLFSDYGKGGLTHIPRMIELARSAGKPVLVDPKGDDYGRYAGATVITPNRAELAQVIGSWKTEAQLEERVQGLREANRFDGVLLTRSEEGMSRCDAGLRYEPAGGNAHRQPRGRNRGRQVRYGDGELRGAVRVRVVVTGAAGMIGSNLVHGLNAIGIDDVIAVDDLTEGMKFRNLLGARISDYFDRSEFYDRFALGELGRVDAIFHEGACSDTMEHNGRYMLESNYRFSKDLLDHCQSQGTRLLYASSAAIYGDSQVFREAAENERPLNVYGYSKLLFDNIVRRMLPTARFQVAGFRYFNVYGPREQHKGRMASVAF